jgi:phosphomannomutase
VGDLKFGTSGLRGLAVDLDGPPAFSYALAFARVLLARGDIAPGSTVLLGRDLRPSSPSIAHGCAAGLKAAGLVPLDCGALPTPALAAFAMAQGRPAIMVTGSHIPEDRNGLKFYRRAGEIDKRDEDAIVAEERLTHPVHRPAAVPAMVADGAALGAYRERAQRMLPPRALAGMRVGVYQHSSVARDLIVQVLEAYGARVRVLGRSDIFVPVDTEALRPEDVELARRWSAEHELDAIVSTDGDADRPLVADERGVFLRGDLVGAVTAHALGADCVVTPVSSNSGIERSGFFARVLRTRIGSPYVIEAMAAAATAGARRIVGFEANGGVLLGSDVELAGGELSALPTRDAMLPILAVLHRAATAGQPLSSLAPAYRFGAAASGRLRNVAAHDSAALLERLRSDARFRSGFVGSLLAVDSLDETDGLRMASADGVALHYRASGNAPELRCYVEAADDASASALLAEGLARAESWLGERSR